MTADSVDTVVVATDSNEIAEVIVAAGGEAVLTTGDFSSGTDRVASIAKRYETSLIVNVQGDDPLVSSDLIDQSIVEGRQHAGSVCTPVYSLDPQDLTNPHIVKAVRSSSGRALYFSRSPVPHDRDGDATADSRVYWGHVGLYVFPYEVLMKFKDLGESPLEGVEKLEQLRLLENDIDVHTFETSYRPSAIDVPEDLVRLANSFGGA